jgi:Reverse transcriptase (RNA-dependent DNA polymerase)
MDIGINPANYRPISNLNIMSKVLEMLALSRLRQHIMESPNFNSSQSAYRCYHSTETALTRLLNYIYGDFDEGRSTLYSQLQTCRLPSIRFSTLCFLYRIGGHSFDIHGSILEWIKSYLVDRSQFVRFGSASTAITNCTCGVPQGSVLGPLLRGLHIAHGEPRCLVFSVEHQQYADDTQFYMSCLKLI